MARKKMIKPGTKKHRVRAFGRSTGRLKGPGSPMLLYLAGRNRTVCFKPLFFFDLPETAVHDALLGLVSFSRRFDDGPTPIRGHSALQWGVSVDRRWLAGIRSLNRVVLFSSADGARSAMAGDQPHSGFQSDPGIPPTGRISGGAFR